MIAKKVESALNQQIELEASSSQYYLAMASWAETQGLEGVAAFLYTHADKSTSSLSAPLTTALGSAGSR